MERAAAGPGWLSPESRARVSLRRCGGGGSVHELPPCTLPVRPGGSQNRGSGSWRSGEELDHGAGCFRWAEVVWTVPGRARAQETAGSMGGPEPGSECPPLLPRASQGLNLVPPTHSLSSPLTHSPVTHSLTHSLSPVAEALGQCDALPGVCSSWVMVLRGPWCWARGGTDFVFYRPGVSQSRGPGSLPPGGF